MQYCNQTQNILETLDKLKVDGDSSLPVSKRKNRRDSLKSTYIDGLIKRVDELAKDNQNKFGSITPKQGEVQELISLLNWKF